MSGGKEKKLAVIVPGIGYHKDKPLLYYAAKLAAGKGYEIIDITYSDMPQKIRGNAEMMKKAAELAYAQTAEQLEDVALADYDSVLFIGKSIGTVALAAYVKDRGINASQIWYTPVEATFSYAGKNVIAFIGDDDPWSDVGKIKKTAEEKNIKLYSYERCNHSLESGDIDRDLGIIREVMSKTDRFIS